ncbi:hypothetical protein, partial [Klebsiella michiganensis]|uniref:hypothetical protein n=1 Tax=Klebsiella michiganensis TaxID=1134687 RepID=UPI0015AA1A4F
DPDAEGPKDPTANVKDPDTNTGKPVDSYPGKIDTVVKITDTTGGGSDGTEPDGKFSAGEDVTYTGTSTVTGGSVEKPVIVINQDPDAPFKADVVPTVTKNGQPVPAEDYTAEVVDGKVTVTFNKPLAENDVVETVIEGAVAAEKPEGGDGVIGGDGYKPGTTDPDGEGVKDPVDNTVYPGN